ncbi:MAG: dihydropteroate synthase [Armatimonadetes bacterium]|nr:dihydropteroate synthase [Armatimonadota bacterium]
MCRGRPVPVGQRTVIMGILNVTPDSFSGDGVAGRPQEALARAEEMIAAGADILDVGGESTRPGSDPVPADEEWARVGPVIEALCGRDDVVVSLDTRKTEVAERGLEAGVHIINDVGGLRAPGMAEVVAASGAGAIIMHMKGEPKTMQVEPAYDDLITEIYEFLSERMEAAINAGVAETALAVDPGFGFGKTVEHNLTIVKRLRELHTLGRPVVLGASRKSTIGAVLDKLPQERLWGTAATCAVGVAAGAHVLRVHDVEEMRQVARMTDAILRGWQTDD